LSYLFTGAVIAVVSACTEAPPLYPPTAPPEIREACALTSRKCTQCHERDRIVYARHSSSEWRVTVERMRKFPGSAIYPADIDVIMRCLNYSNDPSSGPASSGQAQL
jgi:hypothetical protein